MAIQTENKSLVVWLLVSSFLIGLSWAALIPMWQTPDEQAHFAQAQDFAAIGYRPNPGKSTSRDIVLSEQLLQTFRDSGNNRFTYHSEYRLPYSDSLAGIFEQEIVNIPVSFRTDFVMNEATGYPPLYYWYIAGVNKLFWESDLMTRVFLSRIATVFLTTAAVFTSYLLAREVFKHQIHAIATAALVSFHPMWRFVGSGVTSDALFNMLYPLGILILLFFLRKGSRKWFWLFYAVFFSAMFAKVQAVSLYLIGFFPMLAQVYRKRWRREMMFVGASFLFFLVVTSIAVLRSFPNSPLVRFPGWVTLPEISLLTQFSEPPTLPDYMIFIGRELYRQIFPWYWGVYRWLSLTVPIWSYRIIKIIMIGSFIGWFLVIARRRKLLALVRRKPLLIALMSSAVYAIGLLAWNFLFWKNHGFSFGIQGRYFFPNLPEHMVLLLAGLLLLVPDTLRKLVSVSVSIAMIAFCWYCLWFVSSSYYDSSKAQIFFLQASQYKPWFFKSPLLPILVGASLASSIYLCKQLLYYMRRHDS